MSASYQVEPTEAQRWEAFVYHWAQHHGVEMTAAARAALLRAAGTRQLDPAAAVPYPPLPSAILPASPAPPAAPQGALF